MNVQKEKRVEDSMKLLMRVEEGEIVEDSFDKIQEQEEQEQDENEEEERENAKNWNLLEKKDNN
ncbi:hypothetical protein MTR_7g033840 [Medicago truncatula]|uniref:Uncharacterized protein n=1 Tax=Medicago truncatula TaxID=3880 RepID=A0A072TXD6_MEDTR|nr:hypothetical protein MTR_7g033840 [Medicago truncatula]